MPISPSSSTDNFEDAFEDALEDTKEETIETQEQEEEEQIKKSLEDLGLDGIELDLPPPDKAEELLDSELKELSVGVQMFLNSEFNKAEDMLKKKYKRNTHGYSVLMTIKALMTFEPVDISNSLALLKTAVEVSHYYRKKDYSLMSNISNFVKGQNLETMTRLQRHAELIYGEAYLLKALLTIVNDESFVSFVREGMNIRNSYLIYKQCLKWLETPHKKMKKKDSKLQPVSDSEQDVYITRPEADADFLSGIRFGIGTFNLILSLLPPKVIKIVELVGFSGSRDYGLAQLKDPSVQSGLRSFMSELILMGYYTVVSTFIPFVKKDLELVDSILKRQIALHPKGAFFLYFSGRYRHAKGVPSEAIPFYLEAISVQKDWQQLHHICYWELAACFASSLNFIEASKYIEILEKESKWSKAVYRYLLAVYLYMAKNYQNITVDDSKILFLMKSVPESMQRIAGKRIPWEKFVSRKSRKFIMQKERLLLPVLELFIIWNTYELMPQTILTLCLDLVEKEFDKLNLLLKDKKIDEGKDVASYQNFYDDFCLCLLMRAIIYRNQKQYFESLEDFERIFKLEKKITLDHYIIPFAHYEMGRLYILSDPPQYKLARHEFEIAKRDYKKFSLENSLHFRCHNGQRYLDEIENTESVDVVFQD